MDWISERRRKAEEDKASENEEIEAFIASNKVLHLGYADKKAVKEAQRLGYHKSKAADSERSAKIVQKLEEKENSLIFSKDERNKKVVVETKNLPPIKEKRIFIFDNAKSGRK